MATPTISISLRLRQDEHQRLSQYAEQRNRTLSGFLMWIIRDELRIMDEKAAEKAKNP